MLAASDTTYTQPDRQEEHADLPFIPSHIYLQPTDSLEQTIDALDALLERYYERHSGTAWQRFYTQETRYDEPDDLIPRFPVISQTRSRAPHDSRRYLVLPDGRRVRRLYSLDPHAFSIETLCGIRQILTIGDARSAFRQKQGTRQCPRCYGYHLTTLAPSTVATPPAPARDEGCAKCGHALASGTYRDTDWSTVCRLCGHHTWLTVPAVTDDPHAHDAVCEPWMAKISQIAATLTDESLRDTEPLTYEDEFDLLFGDDLSLVEYPEIVQTLTDGHQSLERIRHHLFTIGDSLHAPGVNLFTSTAPLRQALLNQTFYAHTFDQQNMVRWIAAGRFWQEGAQRLTLTESHTIAAWLATIPHEDLERFAGDPESASPLFAHLRTEWVEPTTVMLRPLHAYLKKLLAVACLTDTTLAHLSRRFRLSPFLIRTMATQLKDATMPIAA